MNRKARRQAEKQRRAANKTADAANAAMDPEVHNLFLQGVQNLQAGHLDEATRFYHQVLEVEPDHAGALHHLGLIAMKTGCLPEARDLVERALQHAPKDTAVNFNLGNILRLMGDLDGALSCYDRAIALNSGYAEAYLNAGVALREKKQHAEALTYFEGAVKARPDFALAQNNLGLTLLDMGQREEAEKAIRAAIALNSDYAEAHLNLGNALKGVNAAEAEACYREALSLSPNAIEVLNGYASFLYELERFSEAEELCRKALSLNPDYAPVHNNLGNIMVALERLEEAEECFSKAQGLAPNMEQANVNRANLFFRQEKYEEAEVDIRKAIAQNEGVSENHRLLGKILKSMEKYDESEQELRLAMDLAPGDMRPINDLCSVLYERGSIEEALPYIEKAIDLYQGDSPDVAINYAAILHGCGRTEEAETILLEKIDANPDSIKARNRLGELKITQRKFDEALPLFHWIIERDPENFAAAFNLSMCHFFAGDLKEAWNNYQWRWRSFGSKEDFRDFPAPYWKGEDLTGKRILTWMEQGVGDEIMFASMLPDLVSCAASVAVECDERLVPLLQRSFPAADIFPRVKPGYAPGINDGVDFQLPAGDLPRFFRTHFEDFPGTPYLTPDPDKRNTLRKRYQDLFSGKRLIGISWHSGNQKIGARRSLTLRDWMPILSCQDCAFISLQYGDRRKELTELFEETGIFIHTDVEVDPLVDMDGFAAQVAAMDHVISIDNSTIHVSGAVGVPTWVLIPFFPDWRWFMDREDTVWYRDHRLFRQDHPDDWGTPVSDVAAALGVLVGKDT